MGRDHTKILKFNTIEKIQTLSIPIIYSLEYDIMSNLILQISGFVRNCLNLSFQNINMLTKSLKNMTRY